MNIIRYANHPLWSATTGSKLIFRYLPGRETMIHSLVIEVQEMYVRFRVTMHKSNGGYFYSIYADKKTALKYIGDYLKYYKQNTEVQFENTEIYMDELIREMQGDDAVKELLESTSPRRPTLDSPRSLRQRLSLNLSSKRLSSSRDSSPRTPRTPNSERLNHKPKSSPRVRSLISPRSRSADNSPRDKESPRDPLNKDK